MELTFPLVPTVTFVTNLIGASAIGPGKRWGK